MSWRTTLGWVVDMALSQPCTKNCNQGHTCTCGRQPPTWATTSDPLAWVHTEQQQAAAPIAPQNARRIPRSRPPWRLRGWLIAAVVVASVLCAQALADMPTSVLMKGWT